MISTSCKNIAQELLDRCLAGNPPKQLPRPLAEEPCGQALFGIWVEGMADRFEPALCDMYARLFAQAVCYVFPETDPAALVARYERVRRPRRIETEPRRLIVMSRVTLGADVAVTSVLLNAAKRRFRQAEIVFAGPLKNFELFSHDKRITHVPVDYHRGSLRNRLSAWDTLKELASDPETVVIDPDSRLTQLGLLPLYNEQKYYLFESRAYGVESESALPELAAAWAFEVFGVKGAHSYLALRRGRKPHQPGIALSLGVGDNPAKRLPDPFEEELLRLLAGIGLPVTIDAGAGGEEAERVHRAIERSGCKVATWDGSFSGFASIIAGSRLYVGYDSAGQHVAAASGVPLISIFAGFPVPRMFFRWRPVSPGAMVVKVEDRNPHAVLEQVRPLVERYRAEPVSEPPGAAN